MSFSNPVNRTRNPAKKFIKFSGRRIVQAAEGEDQEDLPKPTDGKFHYFDKEKEEDVVIDPMPPFIVLDGNGFESNLFSVTGWIESQKKYCYSNEVRKHDDEVVVRFFDKSIIAKGPYKDIASDVKELGAKYTKSLYIMFKGSNEICHLALSGGSLSSWLEIDGDHSKFQEKYINVTGIEKGKKGATKFYKASFDFGEDISEEDATTARKLDQELQEYLGDYLKKDPKETPVYDRDDTNTDSWAFVDAGDDRELGQLSLDELNKIREDLESKGEEDGTFYQFVCRACKEKRDEQKQETKPEEKPKKSLKDFLKKKPKEEPTWKDIKMPEGCEKETLGELDPEEIEALKEYLDENELKEEYAELYAGVETAIEIPF